MRRRPRALVRQGQSEDAHTPIRRRRALLVRGRAWAQAAARRHGRADTDRGPWPGDQGGPQPCGRGGGAGRQALDLRAVGSRGWEKHAQ